VDRFLDIPARFWLCVTGRSADFRFVPEMQAAIAFLATNPEKVAEMAVARAGGVGWSGRVKASGHREAPGGRAVREWTPGETAP
jgi:hypothetical protein